MSLTRVLEGAQLIAQGAEAKVYKAYLTENDDGSAQPVLLKHRFPKKYRHPGLSTQLTRTRITSEARSLARCARGGVRVPQVVLVEVESGIIGIEWIDGKSVRSVLGADEEDMAHNSCIVAVAVAGAEAGAGEGYMEAHLHDTRGHEAKAGGGGGGRGEPKLSDAARYGISQEMLMQLIGRELGRMHRADIIHGDLTTSNMLVRRTTTSTTSTTSTMPTATTSGVGADTEIVIIDFGLSFQSTLAEDKAVDLYVLERAFASTHPASEPLFAAVVDAYGRELGAKAWESVRQRLEEVRLRGRKRSMVG